MAIYRPWSSPTRRFLMKAGTATPPIIGSAMVGEVTGFLHIVRLDAPIDPVNAEYRIAFAPLGGRLRSRRTLRSRRRCEGEHNGGHRAFRATPVTTTR